MKSPEATGDSHQEQLKQQVDQQSETFRQLLALFEQEPASRMMIAERIMRVFIAQYRGMEALFGKAAEDIDLKFWVSVLAGKAYGFDQEPFLDYLFDYLENGPDAMPPFVIKILARASQLRIVEVAQAKLLKADFKAEAFHTLQALLVALRNAGEPLNEVVIEKVNAYNNAAKFGWEKLDI